jgi:hypothetical protein
MATAQPMDRAELLGWKLSGWWQAVSASPSFTSLPFQVAGGEVGSIPGAEFGEQRGHVTFDGPHRQVQPCGNIGVGQPGRQEAEDVGFSAGDTERSEGVGKPPPPTVVPAVRELRRRATV